MASNPRPTDLRASVLSFSHNYPTHIRVYRHVTLYVPLLHLDTHRNTRIRTCIHTHTPHTYTHTPTCTHIRTVSHIHLHPHTSSQMESSFIAANLIVTSTDRMVACPFLARKPRKA